MSVVETNKDFQTMSLETTPAIADVREKNAFQDETRTHGAAWASAEIALQ